MMKQSFSSPFGGWKHESARVPLGRCRDIYRLEPKERLDYRGQPTAKNWAITKSNNLGKNFSAAYYSFGRCKKGQNVGKTFPILLKSRRKKELYHACERSRRRVQLSNPKGDGESLIVSKHNTTLFFLFLVVVYQLAATSTFHKPLSCNLIFRVCQTER